MPENQRNDPEDEIQDAQDVVKVARSILTIVAKVEPANRKRLLTVLSALLGD